jgi:translation initiation factor 4A
MEEEIANPLIAPAIEEDHPSTRYAKKWDDLDISDGILRSIFSYGFETMTEIQQRSIYPIMQGMDVIAQAQSGTGKTGSFVVACLSKIDVTKQETQTIILAPTHELVMQIYNVAKSLSEFMQGIRLHVLVGGSPVQEDLRLLKENPPHFIVGCTGRVHDMLRRNALNPDTIKLCVLDEADEMLSDGFREQIYYIFKQLPSDVQISLFSATMPEEMLRISEKFMRDPIRITMNPAQLTLDGIKQFYVAVRDDRDKYDCLRDLYQSLTLSQTIIYANNVERVMMLTEKMQDDGFPVCCIHSTMTKPERNEVLIKFRKGDYRVMISSNVTARGIDVQQVSTVINYDVPTSTETYLHRIGRSGRYGRKGVAINMVTRRDVYNMKNIERHYGISIGELPENYVTFLS